MRMIFRASPKYTSLKPLEETAAIVVPCWGSNTGVYKYGYFGRLASIMAVNYGLLRRYVSDGSFTAEVLMTFLTQLVKPSVYSI